MCCCVTRKWLYKFSLKLIVAFGSYQKNHNPNVLPLLVILIMWSHALGSGTVNVQSPNWRILTLIIISNNYILYYLLYTDLPLSNHRDTCSIFHIINSMELCFIFINKTHNSFSSCLCLLRIGRLSGQKGSPLIWMSLF